MAYESIVTYETLREIQRSERKGERLFNLEDSFYGLVQEYLKSKETGDASALLELVNAKSILKDVIDRRERKILNQALSAVRSNEKAEIDGMTSHERKLYDEISTILSKYRGDAVGETTPVAQESKTEEGEAPKLANGKERTAEKDTTTYIKVKVLEELPEIVGADFKNYGPFTQGSEARLPQPNADLFIKEGKAEVIEE